MPHFFITNDSINNNIITISDKENYNHIARSLHINIGENLLLVDENKTQYETTVGKITSNNIIAKINKSYPSKRTLPLNLYLAQSVLKKEAQTNVIQKACELGIKGIFPMITDNCTIKKSYAEDKVDKYNKLAYEASKQCERPDVAKIFNVTSLEDMLNSNNFEIKIACVEKYAQLSLKSFLNKIKLKENTKILVIIGPEGGFSQQEFNLLKNSNIPMVSLGNLILRADTAVINALSNIIYGLSNE